MADGRDSLGPLVRLRQIACELRRAAEIRDLEVVRAAARLLAPTVAQCTAARDCEQGAPHESVEMALEIRGLLAECEAILVGSLRSVAGEMKRLRNGGRALRLARSQVRVRLHGGGARIDG
jgi:hypothetical protein